MNVQIFDVANRIESIAANITITAKAAEHFSRQIARNGGRGIRISLKESGCSGFMYDISTVDTPASTDSTLALENGVTVYIDPAHAAALSGVTIDYVREGLNQKVKIDNPNITDSCGCGASFSIANSAN